MLLNANVFYWDWEIACLNMLQTIRNPILDKIMVFLSRLGDAGIFWIVLALLLILLRNTRKTGVQMACAMILTFIVGNLILKNLFDRARPWVISDFSDFPIGLKLPADASFPSGHTMNGVTAAVILLLNDRRIGVPAIILALLIAFSRMYNYCHFPTDILGGIAVGCASALIVYFLSEVFRKFRQSTFFE